jgi:hypothetical protein
MRYRQRRIVSIAGFRGKKTSLSDVTLNCILVQSVPGKEDRVQKDLENLFRDDVRCLFGLGKHDFVIIGHRNDVSIIEQYRGHRIPYVLDWHTLFGMSWKFDRFEVSGFSEKPVLGICCIKLNPNEESSASVVDLEKRVARKISGSGKQVYCSLGNYELVCIIPSNNFSDLSREIQKIKKLLIEDGKPLLLDMTTIPCFDPAILYESNFMDIYRSKQTFDLLLSLKMGYSSELQQEIKALFKNCRMASIYGFHDIILHLRSCFGDFFKNLMKLRRKSQSLGIYSTYTIIEQLQKPFPFDSSCPPFPKISKSSSEKKESLSHFHHLLDISKSDPLTRYSFRNHDLLFKEVDNLVKKCLRFKNKKKMGEYWGFVEIYDTIADCMKLVFSQRYAGLLPGNLLAYKTLGLEPHGGIQRAILAAESLPIWLFGCLDIRWSGFCLFGYSHRFYRTECGMINIPEAYRIRPEMWWGLYHEIGHETIDRLKDVRITSYAQRMIETLAEKSYRIAKNEMREVRLETIVYDYTDLVGEIFAEMFGFYFGFRSNWTLYKEKVWTYFAEEFPINYRHAARSVLTAFTLGPGAILRAGGPADQEDIVKYINELEHIIVSKGRKKWSMREKDDASDLIVNFVSIADKFADYLKRFSLKQMTDDRIGDINSNLRDGNIVEDTDPTEIVYSLMKYSGQFSAKQRMTALIGLYGIYWKLVRGMRLVEEKS